MRARDTLTQAQLAALLEYNPEQGEFRWIARPTKSVHIGDAAGSFTPRTGYVHIRIHGHLYKRSRLAWLYTHGVWPSGMMDHMNGVKNDDRIANLRDVTPQTNSENMRKASRESATGILGVRKRQWGYEANIKIHGKYTYLGMYKTAEEAHAVYLAKKREAHAGCTI